MDSSNSAAAADSATVKPAKRSYVRGPKPRIVCAVCGARASKFKYYGVLSCDGCKQFFRRAVVGQRQFLCRHDAPSNSMHDMTKCRSCRLDWCLFRGMDFKLVMIEQTPRNQGFFEALEERRKRAFEKFFDRNDKQADEHLPSESEAQDTGNDQCAAVEPILADIEHPPEFVTDRSSETGRTLHLLALYEARLGQFNEHNRMINDAILEQFVSMAELLQSVNLAVMDHFEGITKIWPRIPFHLNESYAASKNIKPPRKCYALINECVAVVDLFRSMPFFGQLDINDKTRLMSYTGLPLVGLNQRYHSAKLNSELVVTPGALIVPYSLHSQCNDQNVISLAKQLYRQPMGRFNQVKMRPEEFLLLRAIVLAHSATSELSLQGQRLLQREAERYARVLMHYLQTNYGHFGGAKRYAEILALAETLFHTGSKHRAFFTYLDSVFERGFLRDTVPPAVLPILLGD